MSIVVSALAAATYLPSNDIESERTMVFFYREKMRGE
jgi:hypothetical protein